MHRTLMAGMSLLALFAVAGCAQDRSGMASTNAGSAGFGRSDAACPPGNTDPSCTGTSDTPAFGVQPQNRRGPGGAPGAGVPMDLNNKPPSQSPGTLSGDAGKRTSSGPGGN